jgi:hypothetical protein
VQKIEIGSGKKRDGWCEKARWMVRKSEMDGAKKRVRRCEKARWMVRKRELDGAKKGDGYYMRSDEM